MAPRSIRKWWIRTIIANVLGIAILLIGWVTDSNLLVTVGLIVLILSLAVRIAAQMRSRSQRL